MLEQLVQTYNQTEDQQAARLAEIAAELAQLSGGNAAVVFGDGTMLTAKEAGNQNSVNRLLARLSRNKITEVR